MNKQRLFRCMLVLITALLPFALQAAQEVKTIFSSDFTTWTSVPASLTTIASYDGTISIAPTGNCKVGSPSESDQTGKYVAPCIKDYRSHYFALKTGATSYVKIGPIKNLRSFTFVEGNTGNTRGSVVSIQGKDEADETKVLTQKIDAYTGNAQGVKHVLDLKNNTTSYTNGDKLTGSTSFTFTDAQREEAYIIFRNWQNGDSNPGKDSYFFYMSIDAEVEVTTPQVSVTTAVSPDKAGSIRQDPAVPEFDLGSTVTLTATPEFGYTFSKWVDDEGTELSTENPYSFTANESANITAVFATKPTYSLQINATGGGNAYLVEVQPKGKDIEGVTYFEEGTEVTLKATGNKLVTFTNWNDNSTNAERAFTINENTEFTANYSAIDFIVGWDLFLDNPGAQRGGDYYADLEKAGVLSLRKADGTTGSWLKKGMDAGGYEGKNAAVNWTNLTDRYYYEVSFSTVGYTNVKISADMLFNFNAYSTQKVEYSIDGTTFVSLGSYTFVDAKNWYNKEFSLPQDAWNVDKVFVRFIPDYTSALVGATSEKDGTAITNIFVTADMDMIDDNVPPVLQMSLPVDEATGVSASGSIVLTFDERVVAGTGNATLNGTAIDATFAGKTVVFNYAGLSYNEAYTFVVPGGLITDRSGNAYAGITLRFTTMERTQPTARIHNYVVAADGSGDGTTIQAAFDAAAQYTGGGRFMIFVKNGVYDAGTAMSELRANNVSLIGQSRDGVIIKNTNGTGISTSSTIHVERQYSGFYAQDLTIQNAWDYFGNGNSGVAVALYDRSDKSIYKNVKLLSHQDTHVTGGARQYYEDCEIHGVVDFICGGGDIFFNRALLYLENRNNNVIAAPSTSADSQWGYVFNECTIDGAAINEGVYSLARPWQNEPRAVYLNTKMNILPASAGWTNMSVLPKLFAEYNSMNKDGQTIDLSGRTTTFIAKVDNVPQAPQTMDYNPVLTASEAARYTIENVLGGNDGWRPIVATEQVAAPVISGSGTTVSWSAVPYSICYAVAKNGVVVSFTTETSYNDAAGLAGDKYTVYAANEFGGLSPVSNTYEIGGSSLGEDSLADRISIYSRSGELFVEGIESAAGVSIYNMSGMMLQSQTVTSDVSYSLPNGSYIVRVADAGGVVSKVVMVCR